MKVLSAGDDKEAQEAARILVTLRPQNIQMAVDVVETTRESKWPPFAVANRILCLLQNLLPVDRAGGAHDRTER